MERSVDARNGADMWADAHPQIICGQSLHTRESDLTGRVGSLALTM